MKSKKSSIGLRRLVAGCAGVIAAAMAGCDGGGAPAAMGGQVVIAEGADMSKPLPLISETTLDNQINAILYLPLLFTEWVNGELLYLTAEQDSRALAHGTSIAGTGATASARAGTLRRASGQARIFDALPEGMPPEHPCRFVTAATSTTLLRSGRRSTGWRR